VVDPVKAVESSGEGAIGDGCAHGNHFPFLLLLGEFFSGFGVGVAEVEVPFPEDGSVVALGFEEGSNGGSVGGDEVGAEPGDDAALEAGAPAVASGEEAIAGGSADGGSGVRVGKDHARSGECVEVGCFDLSTFGVEDLHIAVAEIVAKEDDDVGLGLLVCLRTEGQKRGC